MQDLFSEVVNTLSSFVRAESLAPQRQHLILEDLKINSARIIDLVLAVEDRFQISISEDEERSVRTVGDLVDLVARKTGRE